MRRSQFIVVATSVSGQLMFFGQSDIYEEAVTLQQSAVSEACGWKAAKIYDLSFNEVNVKPKE
jgi:hypothetical protein